jgi:hypothetical protein
MPTKEFIIHGHFYQPPRENPETGIIPDEPGAEPYRNWNERIHEECYRPNVELKNFQRMSFNVGPTLCKWLESHDPHVYQQIIAQDRENVRRHGVGNAIAQPYNHTILPLATSSDKFIQIAWGIADFKHRFKRPPAGMWLPETAVDYETLAILAQMGIKFIILAPWQAAVDELDPSQPYLVQLPGGESITVFFFERDLSARISFAPEATANADRFAAQELLPKLISPHQELAGDRFLMLASDGVLAHLLNGASARVGISSTFPALWLKTRPAKEVIRIRERTSWSCHHGITRWTGECACTPLEGRWKSHLRLSLNHLASALNAVFFEALYPLIPKPRILREQYIHVMLGEIRAEQLISEASSHSLSTSQVRRIYLLLESQRERQRMFTSCGWFFEDFDRIEPKNIIAYAAHAVKLTTLATHNDLAPQAISDLSHVTSPSSGLNAAEVFQHHLENFQTFIKT